MFIPFTLPKKAATGSAVRTSSLKFNFLLFGEDEFLRYELCNANFAVQEHW
jgi:hypothetical protein